MKRLVAVLVVLGAAILPAQAAAAPAWSIVAIPYPTNFVAGSQAQKSGSGPAYQVQATNVGGAASSGPFTLTNTLPGSLKPSAAIPVKAFYDHLEKGAEKTLDCKVVGRTITCSGTESVVAGESVSAIIPVDVEASAPPLIVNKATVEGGGATPDTTFAPTTISPDAAPFGFLQGPAGLYGFATDSDGSASTQAGSHPYQATIASMLFPTKPADQNASELAAAGGGVRDVVAELPRGVVVNPQATSVRCTEAQLEAGIDTCPRASQIGTVDLTLGQNGLGFGPATVALYNMVPPPGYPAELGFEVIENTYVHLLGSVRSDGSFVLISNSSEILAKIPIAGVRPVLWGVPSDPSHDPRRADCRRGDPPAEGCPVERTGTPFLSMPSSCGGPLETTVHIDSWEESGTFIDGSYLNTDLEGNPVGVDGCNKLEFEPTIASRPTTSLADSPTGLDFQLHVPQPSPPLREGAVEVCKPGTWSEKPTSFEFQWLRNGAPIPGATSSRHEIGEEDIGTALQCEVAASNGGVGPGHIASTIAQQADPVAAPSPVKPTITEDKSGANPVLTCNPGTWTGEPSFSFQWFEEGSLAPDQTSSEYETQIIEKEVEEEVEVEPGKKEIEKIEVVEELPHTLQCEVIGSNAGGAAVAFSSNRTGAPPNPQLPSQPPNPPLPDSLIPPTVAVDEGSVPLATANLKDAKVTLPAGLVVNPSAASGLGACTSAQIGLATAVGETPIRFDEAAPACPDDAKVGSVQVTTPLLAEPLPGAVYLAKPFDNPFDSLLALYLVIDDAKTGIVAKLPGRVEANSTTGQLTASFAENPELPVEDVAIHFFNGARASLTTPQTCGNYTTASVLTPWSTPEGADATPGDSFEITGAPGGGSCPSSEAAAPNAPAFSAGTVSPQAGTYSPFVLKLRRPDGSQRITAIEATLPKGLTGKLVGIPYCTEAQIAQATARSHPNEGALEESSPSCPIASEVGTVDVGAGSGNTPLHVTGHAYWAGPYKGAPLSLVIVTPAVAGPFDLGVVVVRSALRVDPETARIKAVSDPLPTILQGIPLDVRSIDLDLSRPSFVLNPTSCDPMAVTGSALATSGQVAGLESRFQVGGCGALPFKPRLSLKLKGGTRRGAHPALTAVATAKPGEANIDAVSVALPHSAFLEQGHIKTICTRVQFAEGTVPGERCPKGSIYGKATATTPLLSEPLSGPVFLRSSSHPLPDLVVALHGQVDIVVHGRVDSVHGGIRNSFEAVPDAPVTKFTLQMQGGKKGLIVNSRNICNSVQKATVRMEAQNGKTHDFRPKIGNSCKKKARSGKGS